MGIYLIGISSIVGLMVIWVLVQNAWKSTFSAESQNDDALAGRSDCGSCGCGGSCANRTQIQQN